MTPRQKDHLILLAIVITGVVVLCLAAALSSCAGYMPGSDEVTVNDFILSAIEAVVISLGFWMIQ